MATEGKTLKRTHPETDLLVTARWNLAGSGMVYEVWEASDDQDLYDVYNEGFGRLDTKVEGADIERIRQIIRDTYPVSDEAVPVASGLLLVVLRRGVDYDT